MSEGGCACDSVRYRIEGEPQLRALCHCRDCQKITGSTYSTNIAVESLDVIRGKPKQWTKKADSGKSITSHFCGDCGSTLYRTGDTFGPLKIVKAGTLDDPKHLENAKPGIELYSSARPSWVNAVSGADQKEGMPDS